MTIIDWLLIAIVIAIAIYTYAIRRSRWKFKVLGADTMEYGKRPRGKEREEYLYKKSQEQLALLKFRIHRFLEKQAKSNPAKKEFFEKASRLMDDPNTTFHYDSRDIVINLINIRVVGDAGAESEIIDIVVPEEIFHDFRNLIKASETLSMPAKKKDE